MVIKLGSDWPSGVWDGSKSEYGVACLYNNSPILTTEDSNNWPKLKYWFGRFFYAVWNKLIFPKKKKDSLLRMPLRSRTLFFHSVHTFVVYRSIAPMHKLTITPHGEYRTFSHINTPPPMLRWRPIYLQCARNRFIGGKFEKLLWENLNKVLSVSPQKTGKLIKIPEIKYKIYQ